MSGRRGLVGGLLLVGGCSFLELPGDGVTPSTGEGGSDGGAGGLVLVGGAGGKGGDGGDDGAPLGAPCEGDAACESGHCADEVCCESSCTGSCLRCDASPGICAPLEVGDTCADGGRCDGSGNCTSGRTRAARMYGAEGRDLAPAIVDDGDGGVRWLGVTDSDKLAVGADVPVNHLFLRQETAFATRGDLDGDTLGVTSFGGAGDVTVVTDAVTDAGKGLVVATLLDGELFGGAVAAVGGKPVFVRLDPNLAYAWHVTVDAAAPREPFTLAKRPGGGFVAAGGFSGDASLGGSTVSTTADEGAFVVQVGPGGQTTTLWTPSTTGSGVVRVTAVGVDASDQIWIGGYFTVPTLDLAPGITVSNAGGEDAFVAVLDANLDPVWIRAWGGTGDQRVEDLAVDGAGRAWVGGSYTETLTIGDTTLPATTPATWDAFWARLDAAGQGDHVRSPGPLALASPAGVRLGVDGQGNVALALRLGASPIDLGLGAVTPGPGTSYLVVKLAPTGDPLWSRAVASAVDATGPETLVVSDVAGLADGSVAVAGHATTDVNVGSVSLSSDTTQPDDDELWFAILQP